MMAMTIMKHLKSSSYANSFIQKDKFQLRSAKYSTLYSTAPHQTTTLLTAANTVLQIERTRRHSFNATFYRALQSHHQHKLPMLVFITPTNIIKTYRASLLQSLSIYDIALIVDKMPKTLQTEMAFEKKDHFPEQQECIKLQQCKNCHF